jgi:hypothetical protein
MALPSSGPISLRDVNTELGRSPTAQINMNDSQLRLLFGKPTTGTSISMSDGLGKSLNFNTVGLWNFNGVQGSQVFNDQA